MKYKKKLQPILISAAFSVMALACRAQSPLAFTAAQATEGQAGYAQNCSGCHGQGLDDGEFAPPLKGAAFTQQWGGKSGDLFNYVSTKMPPSNAGGLGNPVYLQITAFILQSNGVSLTATNLPGADGPPPVS